MLSALLLLAALSQPPPVPPPPQGFCDDSKAPWQPRFHIMGAMNGLRKYPGQPCCLNDVNGIGTWRGVHHVWHQREFSDIAHVVSTDWVRWFRVRDAVTGNPWPQGGAWDGSVSLLPPPPHGPGPMIMYDSPPEPSNISLARASNADDPFLLKWTKIEPADHMNRSTGKPLPMPWHLDVGREHAGAGPRRVMFPSNVWQNEATGKWNMLLNLKNAACNASGCWPTVGSTKIGPLQDCNLTSSPPCYNISHGWAAARFEADATADPPFSRWELKDRTFHESLGRGSDSFFPLVQPEAAAATTAALPTASAVGGATQKYMLNRGIGRNFVTGDYDPAANTFAPDGSGIADENGMGGKHHMSEFGNATWFASGPSTRNRTVQIGWLDQLGGGNNSQLSCVRSLTWDAASETLLANPVEEYAQLRKPSPLAAFDGALGGAVRPLVAHGGASADLEATFTLPSGAAAFGVLAFGGADGRHVIKLLITVEVAGANGVRHGFVNVSSDTDTMNATGTRFGGCNHQLSGGCDPRDGPCNLAEADRRTCGGAFTVTSRGTVSVRALIDRTTVESFVAGGRVAVAAVSREPAVRNASGVSMFGSAGVAVKATLYDMSCGWLSSMPPKPAWREGGEYGGRGFFH